MNKSTIESKHLDEASLNSARFELLMQGTEKAALKEYEENFEEVMRSEIQMLRKTEDQRWREIFDFTGYSEAIETPKKIPQEVKPAKKIPYYHKRRF